MRKLNSVLKGPYKGGIFHVVSYPLIFSPPLVKLNLITGWLSCCLKMPDKKQFKEEWFTFSSQFKEMQYVMAAGTPSGRPQCIHNQKERSIGCQRSSHFLLSIQPIAPATIVKVDLPTST